MALFVAMLRFATPAVEHAIASAALLFALTKSDSF
jgi:hypothetical protein